MSKSIPIYQYNAVSGNYETGYKSIADAALSVNCDESSIRKSLHKYNRTTKGYMWSTLKLDNILESINIEMEQDELQERLHKSDIKRLGNAEFRRYARIDTAVRSIGEHIIDNFKKINWNYAVKNYGDSAPIQNTCMIVQLSDLHLDQLVNHGMYKYDMKIASARMKSYMNYINKYAKVFQPSRIIVAMTGDLIASDKRIDNILSKSANRAKASLAATKLIGMFLVELSQIAPVKVISVVGNESRMSHEMGFVDATISDNYDYLIHNQLRFLLEGKNDGIKFLNDGSDVEAIVTINGYNFLLFHGFSVKGKDSQQGIQSIMGKYASQGIPINYVLFGHVHFANITDLYARSSSLVGGDAYSDRALNFASVASQNIHIIDNSIHSIRVNLDNYNLQDKYEVEEFEDMYSTDLSDKAYYVDKRSFFVVPIE